MTDYTPTTEAVESLGEDIQAYLVMDGVYLDHEIARNVARCILSDPDWAGVVAEEPEWEYGVRRRHGVDEYADEHTARWWIGRKGQDGERQWLLRRRPGSAPGEWERVPVKQEGADQ